MTSLAVSAQGTQWYISNAAVPTSPVTYERISEVITFSSEGDRPEIDVSSLDSLAREYRLGLKDNGTVSLEMNAIPSDDGQARMLEALSSISSYEFKVVYSDGNTDYFQGLVKQFPRPSGGVDEVLKQNAQIRVTGAITAVVA